MALKTLKKFEIGNVYKNGNGKFFVAVAENKALSFVHGEPIIRTIRSKLKIFREGVSVISLCQEWGVSLETLDYWTAQHRPSLAESKSRNSARRQQRAEDFFWRKLRTANLLA